MQTLTLDKGMTKRNLHASLLHKTWESDVSPMLPQHDEVLQHDVHQALSRAERVIREQEERIRQLESLALTDELTGLMNRRGFTLALQRELSFARRDNNASGILVMIDLDGFKSINDMWGHSAGDDYLQAVAHTLLSEVRANDVVARLGGDEFAILFTRMNEEIGFKRMQTLEQSFNSRMMQWGDKTLPLRASFGLSSYDGASDPESIMIAADLKLYAHKAQRSRRK